MALDVTIKRCNLRYWRQKAGYTQRELAVLAGVRESTVSDIERLESEPKITTAIKLATLCNCTLDDLYEFDIRRR